MFTSGILAGFSAELVVVVVVISVVVVVGGGDDFFFVGVVFSPNPLPPAERAHDGDDGRWAIDEKCGAVNALVSKGPVL